jgi:hypothetical protein
MLRTLARQLFLQLISSMVEREVGLLYKGSVGCIAGVGLCVYASISRAIEIEFSTPAIYPRRFFLTLEALTENVENLNLRRELARKP